jgi:tetratricopeptide (TPR) repeat protein
MAHQHIVYMMLTESAAQARDAGRLQLYAPKLEELATQDDHQPYLAVAHRAAGVAHNLAGEPVEAVARLNQAMEIFTKLETGWQIGRTYYEMGEVARSLSDVGRAKGYFIQALAAFEAMKAMPDIERTRAALGALN